MDRKKIIIIIAAILLLILLVVLFFLYLYKGTVAIEPKDEGTTVYLNGEEYTEYPITIKLKKGNYYVQTKKDGYLSQSGTIVVKPFQRIVYEPSLKKSTTVGYINGSIFSASEKNGELLYYNPDQKTVEKLKLYLSGNPPDDIAPTVIFENNEGTQSPSNTPLVKWSPDKKYAIYIQDKTKIIIDLQTKETKDLPSDAVIVDFGQNNQLFYIKNSSIYTDNLDYSAPQKIGQIEFNPIDMAVSPEGTNIAFWSKDKLSVLNTKNSSWSKKIALEIGAFAWKNNDTFALSNDTIDGLFLETGSVNGNQTKRIAEMYSNQFKWSKNSLVYISEQKGEVYLKSKDPDSGTEKTIYETTIRTKLNLVSANDNRLLFTIGTVIYSVGI